MWDYAKNPVPRAVEPPAYVVRFGAGPGEEQGWPRFAERQGPDEQGQVLFPLKSSGKEDVGTFI